MPAKRRSRGEGSIILLSDGRWKGTLSLGVVDGERRRRVFYGPTKGDVLKQMRGYQPGPAGSTLTVGDWLDTWLADVRRSKTFATWRHYAKHVRNHIRPAIGGLKLGDLDAGNVRRMYERWAADGVPAYTQASTATALSAALNAAVRQGVIGHNPMRAVPRPKKRRGEARALTAEQAADLLTAARGDRYEALYRLGIDAGARQGELFGLHWPDVDIGGASIYFRQSVEQVGGELMLKDTKTEKSRRRVLVTAGTVEALAAHRRRMVAEGRDAERGPVFVGERSGGYVRAASFVTHNLTPLLRRAGLAGWSFKDITRHTCATLLLQAGVNPKVVSERLGHTDILTTLRIYGHVLPSMQTHAVEKMTAILSAPNRHPAADASDVA
jgi:integrase